MERSRVAVLTDAAIDLLAESGMRGLTHRAVDARAGVPTGSTSAYFRTREALIEGVVRRLAELDQLDFAREAQRGGLDTGILAAGPRGGPPLGAGELDRLAELAAEMLDRWLSTGRNRTLARYHCVLEATHRPQLRAILGHGTLIRDQARALLTRAGAPDPRRRGDHYVAFMDGLLFDRLVGAGALAAPTPGTAASRADLYEAVRMALRALTS